METSQAFNGFSEGHIQFPPTFKFDPGTENYDTSPKQRVPSWTVSEPPPPPNLGVKGIALAIFVIYIWMKGISSRKPIDHNKNVNSFRHI